MPRLPYTNPVVESSVRNVEKEFADAFRQLKIQLLESLGRLNRDGQVILNDVENAQNVHSIISRLKVEARAAGFSKVIAAQANALLAISRDILKEAGKHGLEKESFKPSAGANIRNLMFMEQRRVLTDEMEISRELEKIIVRANTGAVKWDDIVLNLSEQMDLSMKKAMIKAADAIESFHTQIRREHFEDRDAAGKIRGVVWWLYDGPLDMRNRDFCARFAGTKVTVEILNEHATDFERSHPLPPSVSLGGYNCRHELIPLVNKKAQDRYPTGPRVF